jgi:hypothetical protein
MTNTNIFPSRALQKCFQTGTSGMKPCHLATLLQTILERHFGLGASANLVTQFNLVTQSVQPLLRRTCLPFSYLKVHFLAASVTGWAREKIAQNKAQLVFFCQNVCTMFKKCAAILVGLLCNFPKATYLKITIAQVVNFRPSGHPVISNKSAAHPVDP